jgi:hypothetical protein
MFSTGSPLASGKNPVFLAVADLDGDLDPDLAVVNFEDGVHGNVSVYRNHGDGTFEPQKKTADALPGSIAAVDIDGDGDLELAIASSENVTLLVNDGNASFASPRRFSAVDTTGLSLAAGDLDGDGRMDLALTRSNALAILRNKPGPELEIVPTNLEVEGHPVAVVTKDLDGYGDLDLASANELDVNEVTPSVAVILNQGAAVFSRAAHWSLGLAAIPRSLAASDLNGDGALDLVAAEERRSEEGSVALLLGLGNGKFAPTIEFTAGHRPSDAVPVDLDGDARADVAAVNFSSNSISVLLSISAPFAGDCDRNGVPDSCEADCNENGRPDECEVADGSALDADGDLIPDSCEPDCNRNGLPDDWDIQRGSSKDCNGNGVPDECDLQPQLRFADAAALDTGERPQAVAGGDLNGDHALDLVTANSLGQSVSVFFHDEGRAFRRVKDLPGPDTCGTDPTDDTLLDCVYDKC